MSAENVGSTGSVDSRPVETANVGSVETSNVESVAPSTHIEKLDAVETEAVTGDVPAEQPQAAVARPAPVDWAQEIKHDTKPAPKPAPAETERPGEKHTSSETTEKGRGGGDDKVNDTEAPATEDTQDADSDSGTERSGFFAEDAPEEGVRGDGGDLELFFDRLDDIRERLELERQRELRARAAGGLVLTENGKLVFIPGDAPSGNGESGSELAIPDDNSTTAVERVGGDPGNAEAGQPGEGDSPKPVEGTNDSPASDANAEAGSEKSETTDGSGLETEGNDDQNADKKGAEDGAEDNKSESDKPNEGKKDSGAEEDADLEKEGVEDLEKADDDPEVRSQPPSDLGVPDAAREVEKVEKNEKPGKREKAEKGDKVIEPTRVIKIGVSDPVPAQDPYRNVIQGELAVYEQVEVREVAGPDARSAFEKLADAYTGTVSRLNEWTITTVDAIVDGETRAALVRAEKPANDREPAVSRLYAVTGQTRTNGGVLTGFRQAAPVNLWRPVSGTGTQTTAIIARREELDRQIEQGNHPDVAGLFSLIRDILSTMGLAHRGIAYQDPVRDRTTERVPGPNNAIDPWYPWTNYEYTVRVRREPQVVPALDPGQ